MNPFKSVILFFRILGNQRKQQSQPRVILEKCDNSIQSNFEGIESNGVTEIYVDEMQTFTLDITNRDDSLSKTTESVDKASTKLYEDDLINKKKLRRDCKDKVCPICGQQLNSFRSLYMHLEGHKDVSVLKLQCGECGKKFCSQYYLTRHLRLHSGEKPFVCRYCGYKFGHKQSLKSHLQEKHLDEEEIESKISTSGYSKIKGLVKINIETERHVNVRKNKFTKNNKKYLVREKGSTKGLYFQGDKNIHDDDNKKAMEDKLENKNTNNIVIQSTLLQENDDTVDMNEDDGDSGNEFGSEGPEINDSLERQVVYVKWDTLNNCIINNFRKPI